MTTYNVSYDLREQGQKHRAIKKDLGSYRSCHVLRSTWLIKTSDSASDIVEKLEKHLDRNDTLLVTEVGSDVEGWNWEKAKKWLENSLLFMPNPFSA